MTPWFKFLKCILTKVGVQDIDDDYNGNIAFYKLSELYKQFWKNSLFNDIRPGNMGNKLRTYRLFKTVYECEPYLYTVSDYKTRQCLSKLRISNHRLKIETGRFNNTPVEQRKCNECDKIEDELHFLTECKRFNDERNILYEVILKTCENFAELSHKDKMIYMMSTCNKDVINKLGKFVLLCMPQAGNM